MLTTTVLVGGGKWVNTQGKDVLCTHVTHDRFQLWMHYRKIHEQRYQYYCDVEGCHFLGSDKKWVVDKHKTDLHSGPKLHCCSKCGKDFGKKHSLHKHKIICQLDKSLKPFKCSSCTQGFRSKSELTWHTRQKDIEDPSDTRGWHFCATCGVKFGTISGQCKHIENQHS